MGLKGDEFIVVWEFWISPGQQARFAEVYGPAGDWAKLFERDSAYRGTRLIRDGREPRRYLTLDLWASEKAYDAFKHIHAGAYQALDAKCESLTERETEIGRFMEIGS